MTNDPILKIKACDSSICVNLWDLEDAEELFDKFPFLMPDRTAEVLEAYNIPIEVPSMLDEIDLQKLLDFLLEDEETQELILAFLSWQCEDLFSLHYSDVWEIKRAAENSHVGTTDDFDSWLFDRFIETRPEVSEFVDFLDEEKCADEMRDYYAEENGFVFLND